MTVLNPSLLETMDYEQPEWYLLYNVMVDRLNTILLKIQALQDVKIDKLEDDCFLIWEVSSSKWRIAKY